MPSELKVYGRSWYKNYIKKPIYWQVFYNPKELAVLNRPSINYKKARPWKMGAGF